MTTLTRIVRGLSFCVNRSIRHHRVSSSAARHVGGGESALAETESRGDADVESYSSADVEEVDSRVQTLLSNDEPTDPWPTDGQLLNARSVPRDWTSRKLLLDLHATRQPERPKQLVAAMLGAPNSGKSTLANCLVGRKICR